MANVTRICFTTSCRFVHNRGRARRYYCLLSGGRPREPRPPKYTGGRQTQHCHKPSQGIFRDKILRSIYRCHSRFFCPSPLQPTHTTRNQIKPSSRSPHTSLRNHDQDPCVTENPPTLIGPHPGMLTRAAPAPTATQRRTSPVPDSSLAPATLLTRKKRKKKVRRRKRKKQNGSPQVRRI